MGRVRLSRVGGLILALGLRAGVAQSTPEACGVPPISAASSQPNIFSDQQEQWLGDATADMLEREKRPARDENQSAYLQAIADRLAAHLPPTQIRFRVLVIDSSEVNGFSLAGGHIYITRKLAALAHSDDELAAVLGHEMGHIASHQFAFETTRDMKRLLGVTSVGDRADVYAKFQKLMDARYVDKHPTKGGDTESGQDEADKVGVYVTAAAGYRPAAFAEFWDRTFFTEGKTGSRLSDFFGMTKPDQKRLRGMLKLAAALPEGCGAKTSVASAGFDAWHKSVVANQAAAATTNITAAKEVKLQPPLHMDLERLRFSPDGKMLLAQDGGSVFAITREPLAISFRFDAEHAMAAQFSPDSQKIVFETPGLHSEEWSVAQKKMLAAHEPNTRHTCLESKLSPDGRTLVCVSFDEEAWQMNLALLDSDTGQPVWEKKSFFEPNYFTALLMSYSHEQESTAHWLQSSFSTDGNYLLIGPGESKLAFDLRTRTPVKVSGALKTKVTGAYAFIGNDQVAGISYYDPRDSGVFSFPEGKQLSKRTLPPVLLESLSGSDGGQYVLMEGLVGSDIMVMEVPTGRVLLNSKSTAVDLWNGFVTAEDADGTVFLGRLKDGHFVDQQRVSLPQSPLGALRSTSISPDGKHLAISTREHGGVWNLENGKQEFLTNGFSGASWTEDGSMYAEFAKVGAVERRVKKLTMSPRLFSTMTYPIDDKIHLNYTQLSEWKKIGKVGWELTIHKLSDASVMWTKSFSDGAPRYTRSYGGNELLFTTPLKLGSVKARLKADSNLAAQAAGVKVKDNGRLLEVVDGGTGKTLAEMVLELPLNYDGTDGLNRVGGLLYMTESDNRTVVYELSTGKQLRQIFGNVTAVDPETGRVCTINRRDEAVIYDADGKELAHFRSGSPLRFASFKDKGTQLVMLTADQTVRTVDVAKGDAGTAVAER